MKEFVTAALPFVLMGLALAVWAANSVGKKEKKQNNRLGQGMIIGLMFANAHVIYWLQVLYVYTNCWEIESLAIPVVHLTACITAIIV